MSSKKVEEEAFEDVENEMDDNMFAKEANNEGNIEDEDHNMEWMSSSRSKVVL